MPLTHADLIAGLNERFPELWDNGMLVTLYEPDDVDEDGNPDCLEVDAVVKRDPTGRYWVGEFDSDELDYASKKRKRS
jgi:hypothetical protein